MWSLLCTSCLLVLIAWSVECSYVITSNISPRFSRSVGEVEWPWRPEEWFSDQDEHQCAQVGDESQESQNCEEEQSEIAELERNMSALNGMVQLEIKLKDALHVKISQLEDKVLNLKLENLLAKNNAKPDTKLTEENNELKLTIKNLQSKLFTLEMEHNSCSGKLNVLEQGLREERQKSQTYSNEIGMLRSGTATLEHKLRLCEEEKTKKDVASEELKRNFETELENCKKECVVDKNMTDKLKKIFRG